MRANLKNNIFSAFLPIVCFILTAMCSCQDADSIKGKTDNEIHFLATVNNDKPNTRALNIKNITSGFLCIPTSNGVNQETGDTIESIPVNVYIRMDVDGQPSKVLPYKVTSGNVGRLSSVEDVMLNWYDADSEHIFYGWTYPWSNEDPYSSSEEPEKISFLPDEYKRKGDLSGWNYNDKLNCAILDKFIGTRKGPVSYRNNGEYVELQFMHLVSQISIENIELILHDGKVIKNQNVQGDITIYDIPASGNFYRNPVNKFPYVEKNSKDLKDITFMMRSWWAPLYVAPEIDFRDLKFKVTVTLPDVGSGTGDYYGDFSDIEFIREGGVEWNDGKESTVLYAGEVMRLNLRLSQGNVTGTVAYIRQWNVEENRPGKAHPHNGIYSQAQYDELFQIFQYDAKEKYEETYKDQINNLYDIYGNDKTYKDLKEFALYTDFEWSRNALPVDPDYVINGLGHTITMDTAERNEWPWPKPPSPPTTDLVSIGNVYDIYITDGNGHTIYIDENQNIWIMDEDGELTETQYSLTPLSEPNVAYQIDLKTGECHPVNWNWV